MTKTVPISLLFDVWENIIEEFYRKKEQDLTYEVSITPCAITWLCDILRLYGYYNLAAELEAEK